MGIPNVVQRRAFLKGTAAIVAVAPLALASTATRAMDGEPIELIEKAHALANAILEYDAALLIQDAAVKRYSAIVPPLPEALLARGHSTLANGYCSRHGTAETATDVLGNKVLVDGRLRFVACADGLWRDAGGRDKRTVGYRWISALAKQASVYEEQTRLAKVESGVNEAMERLWYAEDDVRREACALLAIPANTTSGLMLKISAWHAARVRWEHLEFNAHYSRTLLENAMAVLETAGA